MPDFYDGCLDCYSKGRKCFAEKCFECSRPEITVEEWIHSLGIFHPKRNSEYKNSLWSQAIIRAKRKSVPIIATFGRVLALYLENYLDYLKPYVIVSVPSSLSDNQLVFTGLENCPTQLLAWFTFKNLKDKKWVAIEDVLVQAKDKGKKQRHCRTDLQRRNNIKGIYRVLEPEKVSGRNIILIDDVLTSGATMKECADTLLNAGAKTVVGLALARTQRNGGILQ